jgi:tetratricopeptide (TPR) repeat protein
MRRWQHVLMMAILTACVVVAAYLLLPALGPEGAGVSGRLETVDLGDLRASGDGSMPDGAAASGAPLVAGQDALRQGWYVTAYRHCQAAEVDGGDRAAALICQGRAALHLGWGPRAAYLAQRAIDLGEQAGAYVLLGDAHRAQRDCRQARPAYLRALEIDPADQAAHEGIRQCIADAPSPADSSARPLHRQGTVTS